MRIKVKELKRLLREELSSKDIETIFAEAFDEVVAYLKDNYDDVVSGVYNDGAQRIVSFDPPPDIAAIISAEANRFGTETYKATRTIVDEIENMLALATGFPTLRGEGTVFDGVMLDDFAKMVFNVMLSKHGHFKCTFELIRSSVPRGKMRRERTDEVLDGFGNKSNGKDGIAGNLRNGVPTTGHRGGNVLTDEEDETSKEKRAACCLIVAKDGKILAVSRKDNPNAWGLPGGKVDPGENEKQAAARELQEETGLTAKRLTQVFSQSAGEYITTTFACEAQGQIDTDESGVIRWVEMNVLLEPSTSPFSDYNKALFQRLGRIR